MGTSTSEVSTTTTSGKLSTTTSDLTTSTNTCELTTSSSKVPSSTCTGQLSTTTCSSELTASYGSHLATNHGAEVRVAATASVPRILSGDHSMLYRRELKAQMSAWYVRAFVYKSIGNVRMY